VFLWLFNSRNLPSIKRPLEQPMKNMSPEGKCHTCQQRWKCKSLNYCSKQQEIEHKMRCHTKQHMWVSLKGLIKMLVFLWGLEQNELSVGPSCSQFLTFPALGSAQLSTPDDLSLFAFTLICTNIMDSKQTEGLKSDIPFEYWMRLEPDCKELWL
jgi:hypothetical protein